MNVVAVYKSFLRLSDHNCSIIRFVMQDLTLLPPRSTNGAFHVVVESPRDSRVKIKYQEITSYVRCKGQRFGASSGRLLLVVTDHSHDDLVNRRAVINLQPLAPGNF